MGSIRKSTLIAAVLAVAATPSLFATPDPAPATARKASQVTSGGAIEPEILRLREAAWRAWFASDETALRQMLPPEFLGIDMGNGPFSDLEKTLEESRAFRAEGGRLVRLEFPETRAQQFGDVVVLYGRFSVVLESEGKANTLSGRLTEVFVRRAGRWWHPGWHLDLVSTP